MSFLSKFIGMNKIGEASKRFRGATIIFVVGIIIAVVLYKLL